MKQLFIGLVVLNICYLLFQQVTTAEAIAPEVELEVAAPENTPPGAPLNAQGVATDAARQVLPEPVPKSVAEVSVAEVTAGADSVRSAAAGEAPGARAGAIDAAAQQTTLAGVQPAGPANSPASRQDPLTAQPLSSCVIAGPFRARRDGQALVKQLANAGIDAVLQPRDTALLPDYMVYVGPEGSQAEARALEATFKARKMDSHVIAGGVLQNALSLGVFSRGPLAKSLRQQLQKEGYNARISELTRNRRGYQVRTRLPQLIRARLIEADTPMIDCPPAIAQR